MADERATPLNQGFDKWLQVTSQGELQTWDGNTTNFYEEGTWTPQYVPSSGEYDNINHTNQSGWYVINGNLCIVGFRLQATDIVVGDAGFFVNISGLPFAIGISTSFGFLSTSRGWNNPPVEMRADPATGSTEIRLLKDKSITRSNFNDFDTSGENRTEGIFIYKI